MFYNKDIYERRLKLVKNEENDLQIKTDFGDENKTCILGNI